MKKFIAILVIAIIGSGLVWYLDLFHEPVESMDELVGYNYDNVHKIYFRSAPDEQYEININKGLNEFHVGILNKKEILKDSIVYVYTWDFFNHKKTIWIGKTNRMNYQVIDAIRYKNGVQF